MKTKACLEGTSDQNRPDSNPSGEVKRSGNSFPPLPLIYCYRVISRGSSAGTCTSDRERLTGCSQRENSTLLSFIFFCQFIKAWALRPKRKISNFFLLLLRMGQPVCFCYSCLCSRCPEQQQKPRDTSTLFILMKKQTNHQPSSFEFPSLLFCYWSFALSYWLRLPAESEKQVHLGARS